MSTPARLQPLLTAGGGPSPPPSPAVPCKASSSMDAATTAAQLASSSTRTPADMVAVYGSYRAPRPPLDTPPGPSPPASPSPAIQKRDAPPPLTPSPIPPLNLTAVTTATVAAPKPAARPTSQKGRFLGLNAARIGASVHIVFGHLHKGGALCGRAADGIACEGELNGIYFLVWGFTWVPWFFMLSGFVLTHARMRSKNPMKPQDVLTFVKKRTAVIYPLYIFGVVLAALIRIWQDKRLPKWYELGSQGLLMQAWLPWLPEGTGGSLAVQSHCWFLSALVPFWFLFDVIFRRVVMRFTSLSAGCACLLLLAIPPWIALLVPGSFGGDPQWCAARAATPPGPG